MARNTRKFRYLLIVGLLMASAPALAGGEPVLTYPASFFAGAELATAYDMVGRLPSFVFDSGRNARGFSGTAGNVLVDGARPTAKTDDLTTILQRIPIARVDHIDVIRGGAPGIDMQGQAVVANVVLKNEDSTNLIATLQNIFWLSGHDVPAGSIEFTRHRGGQTYDVTLSRYGNSSDDSIGDGTVTVLTPGQAQIVTGAKRTGPDRPGWGLNGSATLPLLDGSFGANLTAKATAHNESLIYDPPEAMDSFDGEKSRAAELGLHWDGNIGSAEMNLVGLQRFNRNVSLETTTTPSSFTLFNSVRDTNESILRATARYRPDGDLTLEAGLEGAYNGLNGISSETINGVPQAIVGAVAQVHELRSDAFLQASWKISDAWSLEAGSHGEYSTIAADGVPARSFAFLKPRLLLSWQPSDSSQFRLRVERVIGQLDFSNFVATANLTFTGVAAGNIGLKPDQRWQFEGDYEYHFWDKGALAFSVLHENITDLVDYIPLGNGQDGQGNVPKAQNTNFDLELSLPLDRLGLDGTLIKSSLLWHDSALKDPVTGEDRSISNVRDRQLNFDFIQDMPALKSSLDISMTPSGFSQPLYRIAQVATFHLRHDYVQVTWDYKPMPDLDVLFQAVNAPPYVFELEQDSYAGPRNVSALSQITDQRIVTQPRFFLQMRKTF
jgi:hypothetical protein